MSNQHYVVAHPGASSLVVGEVVSGPQSISKARAQWATLLPIDPEPLTTLKLGGFVRRDWGRLGWPFTLGRGEGGAPVALQIPAGATHIHWAAQLVRRDERQEATAKLQLWCDASSNRTLNAGLLNLVQASEVRVPPGGGCKVIGTAHFNGGSDGFLGLGLWGVCQNVGVQWLAVSSAESAS